MEVEGGLDANLADGTPNSSPRQDIAKEFYRLHRDEYDFLVIMTSFDIQMPGDHVEGFYTHVKNDV